jgi:hypothetical protein
MSDAWTTKAITDLEVYGLICESRRAGELIAECDDLKITVDRRDGRFSVYSSYACYGRYSETQHPNWCRAFEEIRRRVRAYQESPDWLPLLRRRRAA